MTNAQKLQNYISGISLSNDDLLSFSSSSFPLIVDISSLSAVHSQLVSNVSMPSSTSVPTAFNIIRVSDIILSNNLDYISKIINISKTEENVKNFLFYMLDMCEKWKFINFYYYIKTNNISRNYEKMEDFVYKYVNTIFIFDISLLIEINANLEYFNQQVFSTCLLPRVSVNFPSPVQFHSLPLASSTPHTSSHVAAFPGMASVNIDDLVMLEYLDEYCPIICKILNPTDYDLIVYRSIKINPFKLGTKIRIKFNTYTYGSFTDPIGYFECNSSHPQMCMIIQVNASRMWNVLFRRKQLNNIKISNRLSCKFNMYYIHRIDTILNFEFFHGNAYHTFDTSPLVLSYRNVDAASQLNMLDSTCSQTFIGPCLLTSLPVSSIVRDRSVCYFDCLKYSMSTKSDIDLNSHDALIRRIYNIPLTYNIKYSEINQINIIFDYPHLEFIKINDYFSCDNTGYKQQDLNESLPVWDFVLMPY